MENSEQTNQLQPQQLTDPHSDIATPAAASAMPYQETSQVATPPQFQQTAPPVQNIYITQQVQQSPGVMMAGAPKSVLVAFLLTFLFGPLGMFYSTVVGGVVMLLVALVAIPLTIGVGALIVWPISIIWGCVAASQYNSRIGAQTMTQISR